MNSKIVLLAIIVVLIISSCASMRRGSSRFDSSESLYVKENEPPKVAVAEDKKMEPAIVVRQEKVTPVEHTGPGYDYYVIVGSFQVLDNARRFRTDLIEEGFTPIMLESEEGFFRVSVAAFNDELAARERLGEIRRMHEKYNDVWLLISM
jgi:cell division protein FtsN